MPNSKPEKIRKLTITIDIISDTGEAPSDTDMLFICGAATKALSGKAIEKGYRVDNMITLSPDPKE